MERKGIEFNDFDVKKGHVGKKKRLDGIKEL